MLRHDLYWVLFDQNMGMLKPPIILLLTTLLPSNQATDVGVNLEQRLIQMQTDFQRKIEAEYQVVFIAGYFVILTSWFLIFMFIFIN